MSIAVDHPTSDLLLERIRKNSKDRVRAVMAAASQYVEEASPNDFKMYKCIERGTTLSPHEYRRKNQLKKCGSVPAVQVTPTVRSHRPYARNVLYVYVGINAEEKLDLFISEGLQRQIARITWDDLEEPVYSHVLSELEFLFALTAASQRVG